MPDSVETLMSGTAAPPAPGAHELVPEPAELPEPSPAPRAAAAPPPLPPPPIPGPGEWKDIATGKRKGRGRAKAAGEKAIEPEVVPPEASSSAPAVDKAAAEKAAAEVEQQLKRQKAEALIQFAEFGFKKFASKWDLKPEEMAFTDDERKQLVTTLTPLVSPLEDPRWVFALTAFFICQPRVSRLNQAKEEKLARLEAEEKARAEKEEAEKQRKAAEAKASATSEAAPAGA